MARLCGLCLDLLFVPFLPLWEEIELVRGVRREKSQESNPKVDHGWGCRVWEFTLAELENDQYFCCNAADQKPRLWSNTFAVTTWSEGTIE